VTFHLARKLFHASGIVFVLAYWGLGPGGRTLMAGLLWGGVALLLLLDLLRSRMPALQASFQAAFRLLLDPKDARGLNGSTLYFGGCAMAVTLTPAAPACGGILALALGDPLAAIVGSSVRSPRWKKTSLAGSTACFAAALFACRLFAPWQAAFAGAATATVLEAVSGAKLDNFAIPVGVALVPAWLS
jgi:dolichol kinase